MDINVFYRCGRTTEPSWMYYWSMSQQIFSTIGSMADAFAIYILAVYHNMVLQCSLMHRHPKTNTDSKLANNGVTDVDRFSPHFVKSSPFFSLCLQWRNLVFDRSCWPAGLIYEINGEVIHILWRQQYLAPSPGAERDKEQMSERERERELPKWTHLTPPSFILVIWT